MLTVADGNNTEVNNLSAPSPEITLTTKAPAASNVRAEDVADNQNGKDLEVSFEKVRDESKISEYRIMVVKNDKASDFNLDSAHKVSNLNYTTIPPSGSNISTTLSKYSRDTDGETITDGVSYRVFVYTVADGEITQTNNLSYPSNQITLGTQTGIGSSKNDAFRIYPNPASDVLNVKLSNKFPNTIEVKLQNSIGQNVLNKSLQQVQDNKVRLDISGVSSGVYMMHIVTSENQYRRKVIIKN